MPLLVNGTRITATKSSESDPSNAADTVRTIASVVMVIAELFGLGGSGSLVKLGLDENLPSENRGRIR